jgi:uncharacterized protein with NAD-binding domain and iron-sulfur cluster
MPDQAGAEQVAVLGCGPAAIAAADELTAPDLQGRYEVTIYQPGWRIGGKCASGRNMEEGKGRRIEEHGLHVWLGFYDNAFRIMRAAYDELARPAGHPLRTFDDAFKGCNDILLYDRQDGEMVPIAVKAPQNELVPGEASALPGFWDIAKWMCEWALREWRNISIGNSHEQITTNPAARIWSALTRHFPGVVAKDSDVAVEDVLRMALHVASAAHTEGTDELPRGIIGTRRLSATLRDEATTGAENALAKLLLDLRDKFWKELETDILGDAQIRLFFTTFDCFACATAGIIEDEVLEKGWEAINDKDLSEWLSDHGALEITVGKTPDERSPLLRSIYDLAFAYKEGKIAEADAAAGTAMNDFLRLAFSYRGSVMWKMQSGMGDTVMTPFYEVLHKRGVKFEFFHAVTDLHVSPAGNEVASIDVVEQVDMQGQEYDPLTKVKVKDKEGDPPGSGGELECWPSEPLWDRLPGGDALKGECPDFEGEADPLKRGTKTLTKGADFDHVVLGIPVGALSPLCGEVAAANPRFAEMLAAAVTVPTQAFQVWLTETPVKLQSPVCENSVAGTYEEPLDTWCDMTHLLKTEEWPATEAVNGLIYVCGVLEEVPGESGAQATTRVREAARQWIDADLCRVLKGTEDAAGGTNWGYVCHPGKFIQGPARFEAQYWRANTSGSERYVLTPKGTVAKRLAPDESGLENLYLAGDWTRNGIDGGCVEAAAASGIQAARALAGTKQEVVGEQTDWLGAKHTGPPALPAPLGVPSKRPSQEQKPPGGEKPPSGEEPPGGEEPPDDEGPPGDGGPPATPAEPVGGAK